MSEPDPATIWHRFRSELRKAVNESTWHIWLERMGFRPSEVKRALLRIGESPDASLEQIIRQTLRKLTANKLA